MVLLKTVALAALAVTGVHCATNATNVTQPAPLSIDISYNTGSLYAMVGALYRPAIVTPKASIAVFVMHAETDYLAFVACTELQERGYTVLCASNSCSKINGETDVDFEPMMTSVGAGVSYLREELADEIDTVVLLGHSGGGALMAAYQNIAENGLSACNGSEKIYPCSDALADLPAADGIMLCDANYGLSTMFLMSLDPTIIDESSATNVNQSLSVYNVDNGFNASGPSNYTPEYTKEYMSAISQRMQRLVASAEERLAVIQAGNGTWSDDEPFQVIGGAYTVDNNKFFSEDLSFLSHTREAWPLLHANGTTTTEIVHSVRTATNFGPSSMDTYWGGALITSVTRFLSGYALRVDDDFMYNATDIVGVQWNSSHFATVGAISGVTVPLLTMGMTGHWEYLNAEKIYNAAASTDKSAVFVEGASHDFVVCSDCETYYGQDYGDTTKSSFDYIASWLAESGRFL